MRIGEKFALMSIRSAGDGNWGWPSCLVLTLRTEDGEQVEAVVEVRDWRKVTAADAQSPIEERSDEVDAAG